jgi:hypothetical protein
MPLAQQYGREHKQVRDCHYQSNANGPLAEFLDHSLPLNF